MKILLGVEVGLTMKLGGARFSPSSMSSIIDWYDASDASKITDVSGKASQWDAQLGVGSNLTQSTALERPTINSGNNSLDWPDAGNNIVNMVNSGGPSNVKSVVFILNRYPARVANTFWASFSDFIGGSTQNVDRLTVENGLDNFWSVPPGSAFWKNGVSTLKTDFLPFTRCVLEVSWTSGMDIPLIGNRDAKNRGLRERVHAVLLLSSQMTAEDRVNLQVWAEAIYGTMS